MPEDNVSPPPPPPPPQASLPFEEISESQKRRLAFELGKQLTSQRAIGVMQTLALVIGIGIAANQSDKLRESIDTSTWSSLAAQMTEVDKQFVERPELVPYFYDGVDIKVGEKNYLKAYSLAVLVIDFMDSATVMGRHIDPTIFEPAAWERFYEYQFKSSPIICAVILDEAAIYGKQIVAKGRQYCPRKAGTRLLPSVGHVRPPVTPTPEPEVSATG